MKGSHKLEQPMSNDSVSLLIRLTDMIFFPSFFKADMAFYSHSIDIVWKNVAKNREILAWEKQNYLNRNEAKRNT